MQLAVVPNDRTIIISWNSVKKAFGGRWWIDSLFVDLEILHNNAGAS